MKPIVDRLETEYMGRIDFTVYEDSGATQQINSFARSQGVSVVPTMMIVTANGTEFDRVIGSLPEADLRTRLDSILGK
jgi:thioredoxin-like negative regulator of GroEL